MTADQVHRAVSAAVEPLMAKFAIPGMAVGVLVDGKAYVFDYGVASTATGAPVTNQSLFELGSVSKTLTATLAAYAAAQGSLSLSDDAGRYLKVLRGTDFGKVTLLDLGTHTAGGLPLQVPDTVHNDGELLQYFAHWRPTYPAETQRTYSNLGIGALGLATSASMGEDFRSLMIRRLFSPMRMTNSFFDVPASRAADYAQGYTTEGHPARMTPGPLADQAYGIKTTAGDMVHFLQASMGLLPVNRTLGTALLNVRTGYFRAGPIVQDLIWEQYDYPVGLPALLAGNSPDVIYGATPVSRIQPPQKPRPAAWLNKTGSTNGFGAYVAFVPGLKSGVVLLANKNYPIADRVTAAYRIMQALEGPKRP